MIWVPLPHVHQVALFYGTLAGPRYESATSVGLSHLVEHLLFRGTHSHPSSLSFHREVESIGGEINGMTQRDAMMAHMTVVPGAEARGLELLGQVCTEPLLTGLEVEREVVVEEILDTRDADGRELDPDTLSRPRLWCGHPISRSITGNPEDVRRYTDADCRRHFERLFVAQRSVVVVAVNFDEGPARDAVVKNFGRLLPGRKPRELSPPAAAIVPPVLVQNTDDAQVSALLSCPAPHENHPQFTTLLLLRRLLDDGFSARLRQAICEERGLAYDLSVVVDAYRDVGSLDIEVSCAPDKVVTAVEEIWRTLERLVAEGLVAGELERAKHRHWAEQQFALDDPNEMAAWFATAALVDARHDFLTRMESMRRVTASDIVALAGRVFVKQRALLTVVGPVAEAEARAFDRIMARAPRPVPALAAV